MRRPVIARKATTQMTRNKAGIIGQQVYLSCARCNAKRARLLLLARASASARQSGFATDGGIAMNNSALGRFIYRRNESVDIVRWPVRFAGATDVFGASGVMLAFSAPGFDESAVKTA